MSEIIQGHNGKIAPKPRNQTPKFNCRKKAECTMEGNCQIQDVVYKCGITRPLPKKLYLGLSEGESNSRSVEQKRYPNKATLSLICKFRHTY